MRVLVACEFSGVPGFPGYRLASDGRIQTAHRRGTDKLGEWRDLKTHPDKKGYLGLTLCSTETGKRQKARLHRLIALAFIPNPLGLPCVRHLDGNPANNSVSNLAWGTYVQNEEDKRLHGTWDLRRSGKLTPDMREEARQLRRSGLSHFAIAQRLRVSRPTISRLLSGKTWSAR